MVHRKALGLDLLPISPCFDSLFPDLAIGVALDKADIHQM